MKCNCESTHCSHEPAMCQGEGKISFDYVGLVCTKCADVIPKEFMKEVPIGTLVLFNNRFGIVRAHVDTDKWGYRLAYISCEGMANSTFHDRVFTINNWDYDKIIFNVETKTLYEFEEAIGENVYDSFAYARNSRVLETTKVEKEITPGVEYWVKLYNPDIGRLITLAVCRYEDGHLRWTKFA